jgi:hypothetical protein
MLVEAIVGNRVPGLLVHLTVIRGLVGTQPQSDVLRLHRLLHHPYQVVAQGIEVRLVPELCGETLKSLPRVILLAVEATVDERLGAPSQRVEQGCYHESGGHHREGGLLARDDDEEPLQHHDAAEVESD